MTQASGVLVVDKPAGITSHGVVARARRALDIRKVGHAGTLDPDATGVLVLGVGQATRLLGYLMADDKEYVATIVLGIATSTDDAAGELVSSMPAGALSPQDIRDAMAGLTGDILQRPSAVSAIKVGGRRAHERVRAGEDVDLAPRPVTVSDFSLVDVRRGQGEVPTTVVDVRVTCSSGTYVRALARDLGAALGVGGHVAALRRTRSGAFTLDDAIGMDDVSPGQLLSPAEAARRSLPTQALDDERAALARHGVQVPWPVDAEAQVTAFLADGELLGIAEESRGRAVWLAVFS